ncbi:CHASE3 domain-containing protein [Gloeocapsopsis dulcis]|uniref:histidine kinase n=1 Tax=Gloeocapsopsis dulcis AAB1 = 1H9 TaxID=1433147 RepID=A0A6N8FVA8_9CHRO|nr:CHASE3 domain-containing protein [Gloeocapsopsis dulcis]MUL36097.1 hybrid sensor histidine kinase/response regulator [Gloeocapsopsis dulcis AAB1 = 1H9]WNN91431.1 CHASE3 domain-containing protein [Gloeocapsopsis dulcis]
MLGCVPKRLTAGFFVVLAFVLGNAAISYRSTHKLITNEQAIAHSHQVIAELETTLSRLKDAESGQRGYLLTGDTQYLAPYVLARTQTQAQLAKLKQLIATNPGQQQQVALLEQKMTAKLEELERTIDLEQKNNFNAARNLVLSVEGRQLMNDVRQIIGEMEKNERLRLQQRAQQSQIGFRDETVTSSIATLLNVALLMLLYYLMHRYIKQRQQAEKSLREANQTLETLIQSSPLGIVALTPSGKVSLWNPAAERIIGWNNREIINQCLPILDNHQLDPHLRERILQGEAIYDIELRSYKKDGQAIAISLSTAPLRDATNQINGIMAVIADISDRYAAEQIIREQAALLDIATDAIFVQDLKKRISFWNKGAERLYGWLAQEALGKNADELLHAEPVLEISVSQEKLNTHSEWQGELRQVDKNGKQIIVASRWTLVRDAQGNPKSILVVNTGITEKKKLEAQLLRIQRMESIGTLAGGIAHDLNNVLTPILMSVQLLQMKFSDSQSQNLLNSLENNVKRGAALVKQVLSFARGFEGDRITLQARHLISEITHLIQETFPKSIELVTDISANLWAIFGDTTQLHQVLMNLVVNARDAMPNGGILSIQAKNVIIDEQCAQMNLEATVGCYVAITVTDTGVGIPPEIIERIFEPFFTTKEIGKGTGLGLATAIGIVKNHGGFVNVYSEVSKGSQFIVYLPATEGTETQTIQEGEILSGNSELILVVDDETGIREVTKLSLETYNYRVLTASNGVEALAIYTKRQNEISVVLLDMMMPSMDGAITIMTLQKMNPLVKIIAISGLISNEKIAATTGSGVQAFLPKPYTAKELLETLHSVIK